MLPVNLSMQDREGLPGTLLKVFFIIIIFVTIPQIQVICIEFNSVSGKGNQDLESARSGWREWSPGTVF